MGALRRLERSSVMPAIFMEQLRSAASFHTIRRAWCSRSHHRLVAFSPFRLFCGRVGTRNCGTAMILSIRTKNWSLVRRSHLRAKTRAKDGASGEWVRSSLPEFQMEIPDKIRTKEGPIKPVGSASGAKERVRTVSSLNHPNKPATAGRSLGTPVRDSDLFPTLPSTPPADGLKAGPFKGPDLIRASLTGGGGLRDQLFQSLEMRLQGRPTIPGQGIPAHRFSVPKLLPDREVSALF